MKKAFITGITGQDGRLLSRYLSDIGYKVWGLIRRSSDTKVVDELKEICPEAKLRYGDLTDASSLRRTISECMPDEIYNLAAQSHVRISFDMPEYTSLVNGTAVVYLLDAIKDIIPDARVYHASTSELFGSTPPPQCETTQFHPRSPYGVAKLQAYWSIINHRESYGMFASQGILFNHESEYRGENFVTRKITKAAARICLGKQDCLYLGNLDAKRDWGYAGDYVKVMHKIVNHETPEEFVIATGIAHSVRDFLENSFSALGMRIESNGAEGLEESYINLENGEVVVRIDPRFYRPAEVNYLLGDATKAKNLLNWKPEVSFEQLVELMVKHDYSREENRSF